ncbi:hydrolase [Sphingobacteriales bacterium UPWRP_1]|nr:hypothetical protein BVG80_08045 [Sphingobacteriales bacterium TSM_CSM]PSJ78468.1 hydrolase [Sphingobacteriales bacterium UPWRP_1]
MNTNPGIPHRPQTALLLIDIQERLMPVIANRQQVIDNANKLLQGAQILNLPVIVTEQYPRGLGKTCSEIQLPPNQPVIEKTCFSCMLSDGVMQQLKRSGTKSVVLAGAEAHICVLKTALDALQNGFEVHVVADAVSSRTEQNRQLALERMRQSGAFIVSVEMILFQLMEEAGTDEFKQISKLIK